MERNTCSSWKTRDGARIRALDRIAAKEAQSLFCVMRLRCVDGGMEMLKDMLKVRV